LHVVVALMAAGASRRMGGTDKLCKVWRGSPLLAHVAKTAKRGVTASRSGRVEMIACLSTARFYPRAACLRGLGVKKLRVRDATKGMSASLRAAVTYANRRKADALIIIPGDLAGLAPASVHAIRSAMSRAPSQALRAFDGTGVGHPTALPRVLFPKLMHLQGDEGARSLLGTARKIRLKGARLDFDRPEDFTRPT
jgi:CTP:molybdopterin cytidylyltransferase MocA